VAALSALVPFEAQIIEFVSSTEMFVYFCFKIHEHYRTFLRKMLKITAKDAALMTLEEMVQKDELVLKDVGVDKKYGVFYQMQGEELCSFSEFLEVHRISEQLSLFTKKFKEAETLK
jgi:hypothetical protein